MRGVGELQETIREGEEAKTSVQVWGLKSTPASSPTTLLLASLAAGDPPAPQSSHSSGSEEHRFKALTGPGRLDDDRRGGVDRLDGDAVGWGGFCLLLRRAGAGTRRQWALSDIKVGSFTLAIQRRDVDGGRRNMWVE